MSCVGIVSNKALLSIAVDKLISLTKTWVVLFRKIFPLPMHLRIFPTFPSITFTVSGHRLVFLSLLELSFVHDNSHGYIWISPHAAIQINLHHLLKMLSIFSVHVSGFFIKNQVQSFMSRSSVGFH